MAIKKKESLRTRLEDYFGTRLIPVFQRATEDGQGITLWVATLEDWTRLDSLIWYENTGSWPGYNIELAGIYWEPETRKGYVSYGTWIANDNS